MNFREKFGLCLFIYGLVFFANTSSVLLTIVYGVTWSIGASLFLGAKSDKNENRTRKRPNSSTLTKINSYFGRNIPKKVVLGQNSEESWPYNVRWHMLDPNKNAYKVLIAHKEFWNKEGRDCPNKTLVQQTGVSKGQVSTIIKTLKGDGYVLSNFNVLFIIR